MEKIFFKSSVLLAFTVPSLNCFSVVSSVVVVVVLFQKLLSK